MPGKVVPRLSAWSFCPSSFSFSSLCKLGESEEGTSQLTFAQLLAHSKPSVTRKPRTLRANHTTRKKRETYPYRETERNPAIQPINYLSTSRPCSVYASCSACLSVYHCVVPSESRGRKFLGERRPVKRRARTRASEWFGTVKKKKLSLVNTRHPGLRKKRKERERKSERKEEKGSTANGLLRARRKRRKFSLEARQTQQPFYNPSIGRRSSSTEIVDTGRHEASSCNQRGTCTYSPVSAEQRKRRAIAVQRHPHTRTPLSLPLRSYVSMNVYISLSLLRPRVVGFRVYPHVGHVYLTHADRERYAVRADFLGLDLWTSYVFFGDLDASLAQMLTKPKVDENANQAHSHHVASWKK